MSNQATGNQATGDAPKVILIRHESRSVAVVCVPESYSTAEVTAYAERALAETPGKVWREVAETRRESRVAPGCVLVDVVQEASDG